MRVEAGDAVIKHEGGGARRKVAKKPADRTARKDAGPAHSYVNHDSGAGTSHREMVPAPVVIDAAFNKTQTTQEKIVAATMANQAMIRLRGYQDKIFQDRESGLLILHWSRQIGKSFTLANWAVDRLLTQLQKYNTWLITVLSNSRDNGAEFVLKCAEVCNQLGLAQQQEAQAIGDAAVYVQEDHSPDIKYENMRMEVRITIGNRAGRIKVLAANPRTARGFSGDLILDEFAFHEDSNAIWEAAEPILSANPEFICRIASTGNGKHNMFYRMSAGVGPNDGTPFLSATGFKVSRVTRSEAWKMGVKIYDSNTRQAITPEEAFKKALDKRAYLQNYECQFTDENMALLTQELINAAQREGVSIDDQQWMPASIARMHRAKGQLECGLDVGRNRDLSVLSVIERLGAKRRVIAMLRMASMRLPAQQVQADVVCGMRTFARLEIDMTGIGLGLCEYLQDKWGLHRIRGVNFSSSEPITDRMRADGTKRETGRVTEIMANNMLACFEDRSIEIPMDAELCEDLRKPEKITSPGGRVSIAATRDDAGHADHFWSIALAIRAGISNPGPFIHRRVELANRTTGLRRKGCLC